MATELEIVAGTYEEFLLGYKVKVSKTGNGLTMSQSFATHSHSGSIRTVASKGRFLATGGSDDRVFIYDMRTRKELQILMHHEGTVNTLEFTPEATHIMTGGSDGCMAAIRTGSWQTEKLWTSAHKGSSINNIAIHPTGKLALSLGGDNTLRTWNLVKGRPAYTTNLASRPNGRFACTVHWSCTGEYFAISGAKTVEIWSVVSAGVINKVQFATRVASLGWISDSVLIAGLDSGSLVIYNIEEEKQTVISGHEQRVKCLAVCEGYVATACSAGLIKMWRVETDEKDLTEICSTNTGCRVTCIALVQSDEVKREFSVKGKKRKNSLDSEEQKRDTDDESEETDDDKPNVEIEKPKVLRTVTREVVVVEMEGNESPMKKKKKNRKNSSQKLNPQNMEEDINQLDTSKTSKKIKKSTQLLASFENVSSTLKKHKNKKAKISYDDIDGSSDFDKILQNEFEPPKESTEFNASIENVSSISKKHKKKKVKDSNNEDINNSNEVVDTLEEHANASKKSKRKKSRSENQSVELNSTSDETIIKDKYSILLNPSKKSKKEMKNSSVQKSMEQAQPGDKAKSPKENLFESGTNNKTKKKNNKTDVLNEFIKVKSSTNIEQNNSQSCIDTSSSKRNKNKIRRSI